MKSLYCIINYILFSVMGFFVLSNAHTIEKREEPLILCGREYTHIPFVRRIVDVRCIERQHTKLLCMNPFRNNNNICVRMETSGVNNGYIFTDAGIARDIFVGSSNSTAKMISIRSTLLEMGYRCEIGRNPRLSICIDNRQ